MDNTQWDVGPLIGDGYPKILGVHSQTLTRVLRTRHCCVDADDVQVPPLDKHAILLQLDLLGGDVNTVQTGHIFSEDLTLDFGR